MSEKAASNTPLIIGGIVLLLMCSSSSALLLSSNASSNVSSNVVSTTPSPAKVPVVSPTPAPAVPTGSSPASLSLSSTPAPVPAPSSKSIFNGETYTFQNLFKVRMSAPSGSWMNTNGNPDDIGNRGLNLWGDAGGPSGKWQISPVAGQPANVFTIKNILRSDPKFTSGAFLCVNGDPATTKADYGVNLWPDTAGEAGLWVIEQVPGQPAGTYYCTNVFKINQKAEAPYLAVNGNPNDLGNAGVGLWRDYSGDPCWWTIAKV